MKTKGKLLEVRLFDTLRTRKRKDPAFTLIELLVVIAIILMLVGIVAPSLSRAEDQAMMAVCSANVRHLAAALIIYEAAAGVFPPLQIRPGYDLETRRWIPPTWWPRLLQPGAAIKKGWTCPAAPAFVASDYDDCGYGYNYRTFGQGRGSRLEIAGVDHHMDTAVVRMDMVPCPSLIILAGDGSFGWARPGRGRMTCAINTIDLDRYEYTNLDPWEYGEPPTRRHQGDSLAMLGYADGHVEADDGRRIGRYRFWVLGNHGTRKW